MKDDCEIAYGTSDFVRLNLSLTFDQTVANLCKMFGRSCLIKNMDKADDIEELINELRASRNAIHLFFDTYMEKLKKRRDILIENLEEKEND